jgi:hypothetical protein
MGNDAGTLLTLAAIWRCCARDRLRHHALDASHHAQDASHRLAAAVERLRGGIGGDAQFCGIVRDARHRTRHRRDPFESAVDFCRGCAAWLARMGLN